MSAESVLVCNLLTSKVPTLAELKPKIDHSTKQTK